MSELQKNAFELLKYPIAVFSILIALIIAKHALGITFGQVETITGSGVKFSQEQKAGFAELDAKLRGALAAIEELKKVVPTAAANSSKIDAAASTAEQTVSDQTAKLTNISKSSPDKATGQSGFIWIGNYKNGWNPAKLALINTGQPISAPPDQLRPGTTYEVLGNMVLRDGQPTNDAAYYQARKSLGTLPRGTKVRLIDSPIGFDRQFAAQYWAHVELP